MSLLTKLLKIVHRTSRHVEEAYEAIEAISLERVVRLRIEWRDGHYQEWAVHDVQEGEAPWRDFQTWFHGRESSPTYRIAHKRGEDAFLRADIKRYRIERALEIAKPSAGSVIPTSKCSH